MSTRVLSAAAALTFVLAGTIPAQVVFDNGPVITPPLGNGFGGANTSQLQTALSATADILGFGCQAAFGYSLADDFYVSSGMTITQVEVLAFQAGSSTTTSSLTGLFVDITSGSPTGPSVPGSPGIATNLFPAVTNNFSGVYRVVDTQLLGSAWPLMRVVCNLPAPIVLAPGTYWLRYNMTGTIANGPWVSPVVVYNELNAGNAQQYTGVWAPIEICSTGGCSNFCDVPFKLRGSGQTPYSINPGVTGCGAVTLAVHGSANLGGTLRVEAGNVSPAPSIPIMGFDFVPTSLPICFNGSMTCSAGHPFGFAFSS
jgi:hypothetical protein